MDINELKKQKHKSSLEDDSKWLTEIQTQKLREKIDSLFKEPTRIINSDSNLHLCVYDAANEEFSCHGISL